MINSVNTFPMLQGVNNQGLDNKNLNVNNPVQNTVVSNPNLGGVDALASYNRSIISNPLKPKVLEHLKMEVLPDNIDSIKGEKVYNSNGKLNSVVEKNEKTTNLYYLDGDKVNELQVFDNSTGKLLKLQSNVDSGTGFVKEYYENGSKTSLYMNGQLEETVQNEVRPDGTRVEYGCNADGSSIISETNNYINTKKITSFDNDGYLNKITTVDYNKATQQITNYKKGHIVNNSISNFTPLENPTGKDVLHDLDLVPAQQFVLGYNPNSVQGEKTYYSNGKIESIKTKTSNGEVVHNFDLMGKLLDIKTEDNKKIVFNTKSGEVSTIEETLPNGNKKITIFPNDILEKTVEVVSPDKKNKKVAKFYQDGKMSSYAEIQNDKMVVLDFDAKGNIINLNK